MDVLEIQNQCIADSERWFPNVSHNLGYMLIALTGEVGEFCNLYKKIERGSVELTEDTHIELALELCDVFIYLMNMAAVMNVDMEKMYKLKRDFNEKRFGASSPDNSTERPGIDESDEVSDDASSFVPVSKLFKPLQGRE